MNAKKVVSALALAGLLASGVAFAQTGSSTLPSGSPAAGDTTSTTTTTPGAPNTGAGGDATQNLLLLATSGVIVLAGAAYLTRKAYKSQ